MQSCPDKLYHLCDKNYQQTKVTRTHQQDYHELLWGSVTYRIHVTLNLLLIDPSLASQLPSHV